MEKLFIRTAGITAQKIAKLLWNQYDIIGYIDIDYEKVGKNIKGGGKMLFFV